MIKYINRYLAPLLLISVVFIAAPNADAQFLKKLTKGLEKVNKTIEKANNIIEGKDAFKVKKPSKKSSSKKSESAPIEAEPIEPTVTTSAVDAEVQQPSIDNNWPTFTPVQKSPFVTVQTRLMQLGRYENISPVHEDIFAIAHKNGNLSFWKVTGEKLFNAEWNYCGFASTTATKFPKFNGGVAVAMRAVPNSEGNIMPCLLYANGGIKELDPTWKKVSDFADGVAVVQQKIGSKTNYFYINIKGEKVYPNIVIGYSSGDDYIRPLRNGLRAFSGRPEGGYFGLWGYMDAQGQVVISPQFNGAGDFSEGFAKVMTSDNKVCLIDTTGKVKFTSDARYLRDVSDVNNGLFYVETDDSYDYYDTNWNKLESFYSVTPFYGGYAFASKDGSYRNGVSLINTNFRTLRSFASKKFNGGVSSLSSQPRFHEYNLATVFDASVNSYVINQMGDVVLTSCHADNGSTLFGNFGYFTKCGYAVFGQGAYGNNEYRGIVRPSGEIAILFTQKDINEIRKDSLPDGPINPITPGPKPSPQPIWGPWPTSDTLVIDQGGPAIGPIEVEHITYNVTISIEGKGSAYVSPNGTFKYGDKVTLTAVPAEDWELASIKMESEVPNTIGEDKSFIVKSNVHLKVKFLEEDDDLPPPSTGCFQGEKEFVADGESFGMVTYYAQINADGQDVNPYGNNSYGFIVAMIDGTKHYQFTDVSANFFIAPLRVSGYQFDETTQTEWMVLDGGSFNVANIKVNPEKADPLLAMYLTLMAGLSTYNYPGADARHYRVEMINHDKESGEFTCGRMETFSTEHGWLPSGDERLRNRQSGGLFGNISDVGLPTELFCGVKFKNAAKRDDVSWYPPIQWYNGDQEVYDQVIKYMIEMYSTFKSDYDELFNK